MTHVTAFAGTRYILCTALPGFLQYSMALAHVLLCIAHKGIGNLRVQQQSLASLHSAAVTVQAWHITHWLQALRLRATVRRWSSLALLTRRRKRCAPTATRLKAPR